jgi:hypothetical protein
VPDWLTTLLTGLAILIVGHLSGAYFERRKQALTNRRDILKPVEEWLDLANRISHIVGDDVAALSQGLPLPVGYTMQDRVQTGRRIAELTPKVLANLRSKALQTFGTRRLSRSLSANIDVLNRYIHSTLLPTDDRLVQQGPYSPTIKASVDAALPVFAQAGAIVEKAYESLAKLKVRLT